MSEFVPREPERTPGLGRGFVVVGPSIIVCTILVCTIIVVSRAGLRRGD